MTTKNPSAPPGDADFEAFWRAYPRKVAKAEARKAWRQVLPLLPALDELLGALAAQAAHHDWNPRDRQRERFIPHASTWLRGERWADEVPGLEASTPVPVGVVDRQQAESEREARRAALAKASEQAGDAAMARLLRERAAQNGGALRPVARKPAPAAREAVQTMGELFDQQRKAG